MEPRYRLVNNWNGGKGGQVVEFTSKERGDKGYYELLSWFHKNKPYSLSEGLTNQGYSILEIEAENLPS